MAAVLGTLLSVAAIGIILYVFTFYIQGEMGIVLIFAFIIAPLVSFIVALAAKKRAVVKTDCEAYVKKGSQLTVKVSVEKKGVFPFAIIEVEPDASEVFDVHKKKFRFSMLFSSRCEFIYAIKADIGGNGRISVKNVYSRGFLGFIKLKSKETLPEPISVGVIPDIPDIKPTSQLFRQLADIVQTSDDDEDNDTSMLFSANSTPGYQHREYVVGDPLKRVNWKLSSKKGKLMVRLDEAVASVQPLIVLDLHRSSRDDPRSAALREEKLLRSVFGLIKALVKQGIACNFAYNKGGAATVESVDNPDLVDSLLLKVLAVTVVPDCRIDVSGILSDVCACVLATTAPLGDFSTIYNCFAGNENLSIIVPGPTSLNFGDAEVWYLDSDNTFKTV